MIEIHRRAAASFDGKCTFSEPSLSKEELLLLDEAQALGFIELEVKDDFGDYYITTLTPLGRRTFHLPEIRRKSFLERALAFLSSGVVRPSR